MGTCSSNLSQNELISSEQSYIASRSLLALVIVLSVELYVRALSSGKVQSSNESLAIDRSVPAKSRSLSSIHKRTLGSFRGGAVDCAGDRMFRASQIRGICELALTV